MPDIYETRTDTQPNEYHFNKNLESFTNRWVALVVDGLIIFAIFFAIKMSIGVEHNWLIILSLYAVIHILIPAYFTEGITLGRKLMGLEFLYPSEATKQQRMIMFILRDTFRLFSIFITVGFILFITGLMIAENNRPALHEKISGLRIRRKPGKNEVLTEDNFDGKFKL